MTDPPTGTTEPAQLGAMTIAQAADYLGISKKALRSRFDRGGIEHGKNPAGDRVVTVDQLEAAGLRPLAPGDDPLLAIATAAPRGHVAQVADEARAAAEALGARIERLAGDLAVHRLLESQAGERERAERVARHALEQELLEVRAREQHARARADAAEARLAELTTAPPDDEPPRGGGGGGSATVTQATKPPPLWQRLIGRSGALYLGTALPA